MKRLIALLIQFLILTEASAQVNKFGVSIVKNYDTEITQSSEQIWCITKDKFGNIFFGNQEGGVTRYDGTRWLNIPIGNNPRIYSLASDDRGIVYVGAAYEFGYIQPDQKGVCQYVSLAKRIDSIPKIRNVFNTVMYKKRVYYQTPRNIYIYDIPSDSLSEIDLTKFNIYSALHLVNINNHLLFSDYLKGMFELHETSAYPLPGGDFFKRKHCTVILPYDDSQIIVGDWDSGLFLYNYITGKVNSKFIDPAINERLKNAKIYSGTKLEKDLFAIGTTDTEGILIIDKKGELIEQINKDNSDLPDNTIYSLYCDNNDNSELWISTLGVVSKAYGFLKMFSAKQGLTSAVNAICRFQGNYYLSTDAGIYKSYVKNNNNLIFKELEGMGTQVFPLRSIKTGINEFLLAGSIEGIFLITKDDEVSRLNLLNCYNLEDTVTIFQDVREIVQSTLDQNIVYFGLFQGGVYILRYEGRGWKYIDRIRHISGSVIDIIEKDKGGLWILSDDPSAVYNLTFGGNDTTLLKLGPDDGVPDIRVNSLSLINNEIYASTETGILRYDKTSGKFTPDNALTAGYSEGKSSRNLYQDDDGDLWYSGFDKKHDEVFFNIDGYNIQEYHGILDLLPNAPLLDIESFEEKIFILKSKITYVFDKSDLIPDTTEVNTSFVRITVGTDSTIMNGSFYRSIDKTRRIPAITSNSTSIPEFRYDMNEISFEWTTPYFIEELSTEYSYKLEGMEENWSKWEGSSYGKYFKKEYNNLPGGNYTFRVKTRTVTGLSANELKFDFNILKPWYATIAAILFYCIAVILLIFAIVKAYTRRLKNENIRLENIVAKRTSEVNAQKKMIEEKNKKITESIHYSKHIQDSILIKQDEIDRIIPGSFVYLRPRDIVSGDFYWFYKLGDFSIIAAVDCTGHGVPGAFMCMISNMLLNLIVKEKRIFKPSEILNNLNAEVIKVLQQERKDTLSQDGMDISVCTIDAKNGLMQFAGAKNPLFMVINNDLTIIEADPFSIGGIQLSRKTTRLVEFKNNDIRLVKGSSLYLFTDGYIDQFGGTDNKSFNVTRFGELVKSISKLNPSEQHRILDSTINEWMNSNRQIDDMLVIGIKL
ncbi:MAG: SpoIIE family protein phosphatase [Bacteroidales bacterium]|nr:SpoIIE family protein phosphatase [Bacteroidales bacterium]